MGRWAVGVYYTRARMSVTAEKARLDDSEPIEGIQKNVADMRKRRSILNWKNLAFQQKDRFCQGA